MIITASYPHKDETFVSHRGPSPKIIHSSAMLPGYTSEQNKRAYKEMNSSIFRAGSAQGTVNTGQGCTMNTQGKTQSSCLLCGSFTLENSMRERSRRENNTSPWGKMPYHNAHSKGAELTVSALTKSVFKGCWNGSHEHALTNCKHEPAQLV